MSVIGNGTNGRHWAGFLGKEDPTLETVHGGLLHQRFRFRGFVLLCVFYKGVCECVCRVTPIFCIDARN